jgi:hypothetical protein
MPTLKKRIAIFFFSLYLFSTTEARQLLKLPIVFKHFQEHKKENKDITFLAFLDMHYMHGSPVDDDYDRDMQLPFKTMGDCLSSVTLAFVPASPEIPVVRLLVTPIKPTFLYQQADILSPYLSCIWQPPRFI